MSQTKTINDSFDECYSILKTLISSVRVEHSLRVSEVAVTLATHYEVDIHRAKIAGLVHDSAKNLNPHQVDINYNESEKQLYAQFPAVWHALVIPKVLPHYFSICDAEIISAAQWHCTGSSNMSALDKIIYVSDYIEPGRPFRNRQELFDLAFVDLDRAVFSISLATLTYLMDKQVPIHPKLIECYNDHLCLISS